MDKDQIHIDDLVRQRLSGAEESERSGAWLQMRELLDKQMPADAIRAGVNWHRYIALFIGTALFSAVTVGGYKMVYNRTASNQIAAQADNTDPANIHDGLSGNGKVIHYNNGARETRNAGNIGMIRNGNPDASTGTHVSSAPGNTSESISAEHENAARSVSAGNDNAAGLTNGSIAHAPGTYRHAGSKPADHSAIRSANSQHTHRSAEQNISSAGNSSASPANVPSEGPGQGSQNGNAYGNSTNAGYAHNGRKHNQRHRGDMNTTGTGYLSSGNGNAAQNEITADALRMANAGMSAADLGSIRRDTIEQITLLQKYHPRSQTFHTDTISEEKLVVERVRQSASAPVEERTIATLPSARTLSRTQPSVAGRNVAATAAVVPQSGNAAVHSVKQQQQNAWSAKHLKELMDDAKENLQSMEVVPGIIAGINTTLGGANTFGGFQLGLSSLFAINEKWSVVAELKYMNRINGGKSLSDNQTSISGSSPVYINGQLYNAIKDSMVHNYNFSMLHSLELPVAVRYAVGNLKLMLGTNFVYNFGVNPKEVSYKISSYTNESSSGVPDRNALALSDFKARFGIGYLLGMGYEVTPQMTVDMRMVQTVWDNADGAGARRISSELYKHPSLQLSISYLFGRPREVSAH